MRSMFLALLLTFVGFTAEAQQKVWPIISFGQAENLYECLDRVTNIQQLVAASDRRIIQGGNCTFGTPQVEFAAYWHAFHESERFIFPVVELDYYTDGRTRFSNDGIYLRSQWEVSHSLGPDACMRSQRSQFGGCLVPKTCDALRGLNIPTDQPTWLGYIRVPPRCNNLR